MEELAKKHLDHKVAKQNLAERAEQSLTFAYNGGLFKITPEFISFISLFDEGDYPFMVVKDAYGNPVKIESVSEFFDMMKKRYHEVMNDWHSEYEELRKVRRAEQL